VSIIQNEDDADDITQDVFIQVFRSVSSFKGESKFSTWLYRIVISKSLDHVKKTKRKKRFAFVQSFFGNNDNEEIHPEEFNHPGIVTEKREASVVLFKALQKVPDNQRIAFTLHKLEAQKYSDIAEILGLSLQAVESLMARAKANLRKILQQYYSENYF
jgi:RNA polymerase sigma-70 factor (ECF subfamily)